MTIEFRCSQCNQLLRVPDTSAGKNARCPKCQALMQVPSAEGTATAMPPPPPFTPSGPSGMPTFGAPAPPPPPPPPASNDPFAFLNSGGGAASGGGALPPPPKNPFGEPATAPFGGKPAPSINPYASPSGAAQAFQPVGSGYGGRPGLPWESKGQSFATWWETAKLCLTQPTYAFSIMRQYGGLGQPMMYSAAGLGLGVFGQMIWYLPFLVIMALAVGAQGQGGPNGGEVGMMIGVQVISQIVTGIFTVALGATIGLLIAAAISHVCLMIVGGARQGYETTLRVCGYAQGSTAWLNVIPFVGGLIAFVWLIVLEIIGFAQAHETTIGKAALAVLMPIIACCAFIIVIMLIVFGLVGASVANN